MYKHPIWKGFNIGLNSTRAQLSQLRFFGANLVRASFTQDNQTDIALLQTLADTCHDAGIYLMPVCQPTNTATLPATWTNLAARLCTYPAIRAYDVANEQNLQPQPLNTLHNQITAAIRRVDEHSTLVLQTPSNSAPHLAPGLIPIHDANVLYSIHMYLPLALTHQGINQPLGPTYPQDPAPANNTTPWNKTQLHNLLQPLYDTGLDIIVGEFSCVRWAPGTSADTYNDDSINAFDTFGWSWLYHCWQLYQGWNCQIAAGTTQAAALTYPPPPPLETPTLRSIQLSMQNSDNNTSH